MILFFFIQFKIFRSFCRVMPVLFIIRAETPKLFLRWGGGGKLKMRMQAVFLEAPDPQFPVAFVRDLAHLSATSAGWDVEGWYVEWRAHGTWSPPLRSGCYPHGIMKFYAKMAGKDFMELFLCPCQWHHIKTGESLCVSHEPRQTALGPLIPGSCTRPGCGARLGGETPSTGFSWKVFQKNSKRFI